MAVFSYFVLDQSCLQLENFPHHAYEDASSLVKAKTAGLDGQPSGHPGLLWL